MSSCWLATMCNNISFSKHIPHNKDMSVDYCLFTYFVAEILIPFYFLDALANNVG